MKAFLEVSLVSLTLRARTVFKNFWKNAASFAVLLNCFAAQKQTSTLTLQKFGFFYSKFSAEFIEISLFF